MPITSAFRSLYCPSPAVTSHNSDGADGPAYNVLFNYDLDVMFYGRQQGSGNIELAEEIFTPEFMERLRNQGEMMTDQFKIKHLGIENVSTRDGLSVSEADMVEIYDIQLGQSGAFIGMVKSMLKAMATPVKTIREVPTDLNWKYRIRNTIAKTTGTMMDNRFSART